MAVLNYKCGPWETDEFWDFNVMGKSKRGAARSSTRRVRRRKAKRRDERNWRADVREECNVEE